MGWDWQHGVRIPGCLGFALTRINKKSGERKVIETKLPFDGESNHDWKSEPSTTWPIQRKWWIDFTGKTDETYTYEVVSLAGKPGNLTQMADIAGTSNEITLTTQLDETFSVAFTRGILSTQWLANMIGLNVKGEPDFQKIIDALEDYASPNNQIRAHLMGNVPAMLMAPITECADDGGQVNLALYELSARQLVDFLVKHLKYFSLILGNTGHDDLTNAPARKLLHSQQSNIHDRMIGSWGIAHNKSQVKCDKDGKPVDVTTGSTNWTDTGMGCQSNIVVRIRNVQVAENFMDYWKRMLAEGSNQSTQFRSRNAQGYPVVNLTDGTTIECWFEPTMPEKSKPSTNPAMPPALARVKELMDGAKESIVAEVFYPGKPSVVHWMAQIWDLHPELYMFMTVSTPDALRGVRCLHRKGRPPLFTVASGREKAFADYRKELAKLPEAHAITHGKILVIDAFGERPIVIFGSHNLGYKASYANDENLIIVIGNKSLSRYVFAHLFDINKHFLARSVANARQSKQLQLKADIGYTGRLSTTDDWQEPWLTGYKAVEAGLLVTDKWNAAEVPDDPNARSDWAVIFVPQPAQQPTTTQSDEQTAAPGSTESSGEKPAAQDPPAPEQQ